MEENESLDPSAWTGFVRLTHWLIAFAVLVNFFNDTGYWHRLIGYVCVLLVGLRVLYGLTSVVVSSQLHIPSYQKVKSHFLEMLSGQLQPNVGHNPLGQWAIYIMWTLILLLAITGWLSRTDAYWGEDWPVDLHMVLSNLLQAMVVLHLLAIIVMSKLQKQNLIKKMIK
jgi:cytochrome b